MTLRSKSLAAVANSGGPDSICLLHLLASLLKDRHGCSGLPSSVVSIHVDHGLQAAASEFAEVAAQEAHKENVLHRAAAVAWGTGSYPALPREGEPLEELAREARHFALFTEMVNSGAGAVAYGHHADDQVETAIMRLAKSSGETGAGGMRPVRRWGMGDGRMQYRDRGMSRWIVRPLLTVPKDRILATCDLHKLQYANDPTNFQPDIAIRNALRQVLNIHPDQKARSVEKGNKVQIGFSHQPMDPQDIVDRLLTRTPGLTRNEGLREAVRLLGQEVEITDTRVDNLLPECLHTNNVPPSVAVLKVRPLLDVTEGNVKRALVRRLLRYISPRKWGSIKAEVSGRLKSLDDVISQVWDPKRNFSKREDDRRTFTCGADVVWVPGVVDRNGIFKRRASRRSNEELAWWIQRMAPFADEETRKLGPHFGLVIDITDRFLSWEPNNGPITILYDARFLIKFDMNHERFEAIRFLVGQDGTKAKIIVQPSH
ncbi:hypothetical protein WOLCODRAFT_142225 [Wolfiporia cocos MD-104 SS10]|uniref:tRNA(Ile)-lysidine synthetase n=1 Tax=Wolfiporia cocos (strain MD-104) TaxID=742152 RepID=A0A2H3J676_WOLCO|nr:hypothetical protein WOLCODRAFT_142225 [Wolfiporia cocos MD-104 SS10]